MFIGHYALAFAAKKATPATSLGTLFFACQLADLLWPLFLLLGLEVVEIDPGNTLMTPMNFVSYPYSHSLVMLLMWSGLVALGYRVLKNASATAMIVVAGLVLSHFVLDVLTHRPDMPLALGGSQRLGLGLWNHPGAALAIESALFIIGAAIYNGATRARDGIGRIGLWSMIVVLVAIYFSALYGPPPSSPAAVAAAGNLLWLFVPWAWWVDRHRVSRSG